MLDAVPSNAFPKPKLAKNLKPPNVAIVMPKTSIVTDMAGALKLREEQGGTKSLYVFWQNVVSMSDPTVYHARPLDQKKKKVSKKSADAGAGEKTKTTGKVTASQEEEEEMEESEEVEDGEESECGDEMH